VQAFLDDWTNDGSSTECGEFFMAFRAWCAEKNILNAGNEVTFRRDLRTVRPHLEVVPRRAGNDYERVYKNIGLNLVASQTLANWKVANIR
jgi:hypothetical protein